MESILKRTIFLLNLPCRIYSSTNLLLPIMRKNNITGNKAHCTNNENFLRVWLYLLKKILPRKLCFFYCSGSCQIKCYLMSSNFWYVSKASKPIKWSWFFKALKYQITLKLLFYHLPNNIHATSFWYFCWCQELATLQLNSCNSNSCNSKGQLNRANSSVPPEFTSKPLQENSFNSNSHNSKNHLNRTNVWVSWTYFSSRNSNFGVRV